MAQFVAFLRGINVSGRKLIRMQDLSRHFSALGCRDVKTILQSGNVIFEGGRSGEAAWRKKLEAGLYRALGYDVTVLLRSMAELEKLVQLDAFKNVESNVAKLYVTFLPEAPGVKAKVPLFSPKRDVEVIRITGRDIFSLSHPVKGSYGFPNALIEKHFDLPATTRNWNTVCKIVA